MSSMLLLLLMLFMHVLDDFVLQPAVLSKLKQKSWWEKNAPNPKYKHDYIAALIAHSFSWTFCVMLPIAMYYSLFPPTRFYALFAANMALHGFIDHMKANKMRINLIFDQSAHIYQILLTYTVLILM